MVGEAVYQEDAAYKEALVQKIAKDRLQDQIKFIGSVPHKDIAAIYQAADLSVNLCPTGGMDKAALESMAAGLPVVSTDVGNVGEICKDGISCFAVPVGEKNPLVHALSRLIADDKLREQMGKEARKATTFLSSREEYYREYARLISLCTHEQ